MAVRRFPLSGFPTGDLSPTAGTLTFGWGIYGRDLNDFFYEVFPRNSSSNLYATEADPLTGRYRASRISFEPFQGDKTPTKVGASFSDSTLYDHPINDGRPTLKAIVTYSTVQSDIDNNQQDPVTMLTHNISIGGEYIQFTNERKLNWSVITNSTIPSTYANVGTVQNGTANFGFVLPTIEHQITWHRIVSPPFEAIRARLGTVNSDLIEFVTGKILPHTFLLLGAEISRDILSDGTKAWNVSYRFSERRIVDEPDPDGASFSPPDYMPETGIIYTQMSGTTKLNSSHLVYGRLLPGATSVREDPDAIWYGGWNHFFDESDVRFKILRSEDTGLPMYRATQFSPALFTQV